MKTIVAILAMAFIFSVSDAVVDAPSPFIPEVDKRFKALEKKTDDQQAEFDALTNSPAGQPYDSNGILAKRIARVPYDVALHGGAIGGHALGISLPAKSLITRSYFYTVTQFVDAGSGTVALSCEDADNIFAATDITGNAVASVVDGTSTGTAASMVKNIAANCELTATVAGAAQTAGKLILFVEYVVVE